MNTDVGNYLAAVYELLAYLGRRARLHEQNASDGDVSGASPSEAGDADLDDQRRRHATPGGLAAQVGKVRQGLENRGSHRVRTHSGELN